jgi:NAD(P)-dependent dehydrogenase (short-subunit alcohol dehydrogenase family)
MRGLQGKIALVTGATGILGRAIIKRLAAEGVIVIATSRNLARAQQMLQEQGLDHSCFAGELDLSDTASIEKLVASVSSEPGPPTIVIASASCRDGLSVPFPDVTHQLFTNVFDTDIAGHCMLIRAVVGALDGRSASVIFLSSIYGLMGVDQGIYPPGFLSTPVQYAATKGAAISAARWLAAFWGSKGTRVNVVSAGGVSSHRNDNDDFVKRYSAKTMLGRMASADEIASAVSFLASDEASYITGECLVVDGGLSAW